MAIFEYVFLFVLLVDITEFILSGYDNDCTLDANTNEEGRAGVEVCIYLHEGNGLYTTLVPDVTSCVTANSDGNYKFEHLPFGDYIVVVSSTSTVLDNYVEGRADAGVIRHLVVLV